MLNVSSSLHARLELHVNMEDVPLNPIGASVMQFLQEPEFTLKRFQRPTANCAKSALFVFGVPPLGGWGLEFRL